MTARHHKLIAMGSQHTRAMESTVRFAAELSYDVTVVKDATADYLDKEKQFSNT